MSLMRALGVVRRQFTNRGSVLRAGYQKAIPRARVAAFGIRRSKHCWALLHKSDWMGKGCRVYV